MGGHQRAQHISICRYCNRYATERKRVAALRDRSGIKLASGNILKFNKLPHIAVPAKLAPWEMGSSAIEMGNAQTVSQAGKKVQLEL
jgi:hypothetical protein